MSTNVSYLVAAKRSSIGRFLGGLSKLSATAIGTQVATKLIDDAGADRAAIGEVLCGQVLQAGCGQNPARQVALGAGIPDTIAACTVNKVCGSGLKAVMIADQVIRAGDADLILAGGIESMSNAPHLCRKLRGGHKFGNVEMIDSMLYDGLTDVYDRDVMGLIAEETATKAGATRRMQDEWALRSHQRAAKADGEGLFDAERVPIELPRGGGVLNRDETYREDASLESLAKLKRAFA